MKRTKIIIDPAAFPDAFRPFLAGEVYDSSCSRTAQVWFLNQGNGYYLKKGPKDTLREEADMTRFFHQKGLAAEVLAYESLEEDWLLTTRVAGEDLTHPTYLSDPKRLCDAFGETLRMLHGLPTEVCPVQNKNERYLTTAANNRNAGLFDPSYSLLDTTAEEAWQYVKEKETFLQKEVLLHGDYCLPNLLLDHWKFSGFIDLGGAGIGDRHIDLFWGAWTLQYNLKTDAYRERFFEAYGKDKVDTERLRLISYIECFG